MRLLRLRICVDGACGQLGTVAAALGGLGVNIVDVDVDVDVQDTAARGRVDELLVDLVLPIDLPAVEAAVRRAGGELLTIEPAASVLLHARADRSSSRSGQTAAIRRSVSCRIEAVVTEPTDVVLSVAVASVPLLESESLVVSLDGDVLPWVEVVEDHGTRLQVLDGVGPGRVVVTYEATALGTAPPTPVDELDRVRYVRPSRYCESDRLTPFARDEFRGLQGVELVLSVSSWVGQRVAYVSGSSRPTDGAVSTLLERQGVCRDFAHLVVALLRACDVPARVVSVYAPGLDPMDFHAVAAALVDGRWLVVDATCLAPRSSLLRVATGRDAADVAFLTSTGTSLELTSLEVHATTDGDLPTDDLAAQIQLG